MKILLGITILAATMIDIDRIGLINDLKSEAKQAYARGDYAKAIENYRTLVDSLNVKEEEVMMNLANAYFNAKDSINASGSYRSLAQSKNPKMKSLAHQQLGVLSNRSGNFEDALTFFKESLKADPSNEDARYNYEMVKKKLEEQKKQDQQNKDQNKDQKDENKDKENKDKNKEDKDKDSKDKDQNSKDSDKEKKEQKDQEQKDKEKKDQEQQKQDQDEKAKDKKDIPPSVSEKLKEMQMSEEKAKMILEAMKNQEIQYLQQNKRKATKPKDKAKPDW